MKKNIVGQFNKKGFTFIEMIVTLVIIALLSAIAIPSVYAYMEKGKQMERDNIARTLFLSAQNQLAQMRITKNLQSFVSSSAINIPSGTVNWLTASQISEESDIKYIIKEKSDVLDENNPVVKLFKGEIVNDDILKNSICIEFDSKTGAVLSVFYSSIIKDGESLDYINDGSFKDMSGDRPYANKKERKQGYYGGEGIPLDVEHDSLEIELYQGEKDPLKDLDGKYSDLLYAEIKIPKSLDDTTYELKLLDDKLDDKNKEILDNDGNPLIFTFNSNKDNADLTLKRAKQIAGEKLIYKSNIDPSAKYHRYIWVLDLLEEDSYSYNKYSIGGEFGVPSLKPQMIKASIKDKNNEKNKAVSSLPVHSHYNNEMITNATTSYGIDAPRHLYNIRYNLDGNYNQGKNIDLNEVKNLLPLTYSYKKVGNNFNLEEKAFTGAYVSNKNKEILNITINSTNSAITKVGLFGTVGTSANMGKIEGVYLASGNIKTTKNGSIGSLVGELTNGAVTRSSSFSNVLVADGATAINAGGLVGSVGEKGIIDQCYNGGFYKAVDSVKPSDNDYGSISVSGTGYTWAAIGGLAGVNSGNISNSYNNARVQIESVNVANDGDLKNLSTLKANGELYTNFDKVNNGTVYIGGISGTNYGKILNVYNTNFIGKTKTVANCSTGGISGFLNTDVTNKPEQTNAYYLPNGEVSIDEISVEKSKEDLSANPKIIALGSNFKAGTGYKGPYDDTTVANYPYPTLYGNAHKTPWEDIGVAESEEYDSKVKYYEIYDGMNPKTGGKYGLWSQGNDQLAYDKKVIQEGYALFSDDFKVPGNSTKMFVSDRPGGSNFLDKKVGFETSIEQIPGVACIVFNTIELEDVSLGLNPLYVEIGKGNSGKADYFKGYINPLFAKAIYEEKPNVASTDHYVRSPRHLDNIDFERTHSSPISPISPLTGKFSQDVDVDFTNINSADGYKKIKDASEPFSEANIEKMIFNKSVVEGKFTGVYNGYSQNKINSIIGFKNTSPIEWWIDNVGIFEINAGTIKGLTIESSKIVSGAHNAATGEHLNKGIGVLAGINSGTIGGIADKEAINVTGSAVEGKGSNLGGLVGINTTSGSILNASTTNLTVTSLASANYNIGGLVGSNSGLIGSVSKGALVANAKIIGDEKDVGGLVGINLDSGKIFNAIVSGASISSTVDWSNNFGGIAGSNNGQIGTTEAGVAIYNSVLDGKSVQYAGGIAGQNKGQKAYIENAMVIDTEVKGNDYLGGIAGSSDSRISNVLISYTTSGEALRSPQTEKYTCPIKSNVNYTENLGGIVGQMGNGKITNAYVAAAVDGNVRTISGNNIEASKMENSFYLVGYEFNDEINEVNKQGKPLISTELKAMRGELPFTDDNGWEKAKGDYPYPVLKNLPEPTTWCAEISLAYYEKYQNDNKLYCWLGENHDELKDKVVEEDGYAVIGLPTSYGKFTAKVAGEEVYDTPFEGKLLMNNSFLENLPKVATELDIPQKLELYRNNNSAKLDDVYFIPTFAKQIYNNDNPVNIFEIRSPRHFKNVYDFASNEDYKDIKSKKFYQTNDIDFDVYKTNNLTIKIDKSDREKYFYGIYDGTKKSGISTIKNVKADSNDEIGGLFLWNEHNSKISNLVLENFNVKGFNETGGMVAYNAGRVENISLRNSKVESNGLVGGLIGVNHKSIKNCNVLGTTIKSESPQSAGSLVGSNWGAVENVYVYSNESRVVDGSEAGGLIGRMGRTKDGDKSYTGTLKNAYYAAQLPTSGKLIGHVDNAVLSEDTENVYLLVDVGINNGNILQSGIIGETMNVFNLANIPLEELGDIDGNIWQLNATGSPGHYYPILKFEAEE